MRTAFSEVPQNFFIFRCCLIHLKLLCVASHKFYTDFKVYCAKNGKSISGLIEQAMIDIMENR